MSQPGADYELGTAHVHSLHHDYTSISYFTLSSGCLRGPPLVPKESDDGGGMQEERPPVAQHGLHLVGD